jgi:hypothetical protein
MKILFAGACLALLVTLPAMAQTEASLCTGQIAIYRVSTIKPGQRATFDKAIADQKKWYVDHQMTTNKIVVADVIDFDGKSAPTISTTDVMTIHYDPPSAMVTMGLTRDDGYKAFVAEFRASSDIKSETNVCLPK